MRSVDEGTRRKLELFVEEHASEQVQFVIDLSHQNSFSHNKPGTDRVAEMILEKLAGIFPHHRIVEQESVGNLHFLSNAADDPSIYLLGHMDTVFPPDHPFRECHIEGDELHGPGAGDMKAGLATIVFAVLALEDAGVLDRVPLTVALSGDEEIGAVTSRAFFEKERETAFACLVVEGGGVNGEVVTSRNGKMGIRLDCRGENQHVGTVNLQKSSAVLELAHKTIALEALNGEMPGIRVNVGKVEGGLGPATIPARASALVDVRWEEQRLRGPIMDRIEAVAAREDLEGCASQVTIMNERDAWPLTNGTQKLADLIGRVGEDLGLPVGQEHRLGTSDSNFFGSAGIPTVDGLGPICKGYHTQDELVYISSIRERTLLLANAIVAVAGAYASGKLGV